jgi:hypothetical protein
MAEIQKTVIVREVDRRGRTCDEARVDPGLEEAVLRGLVVLQQLGQDKQALVLQPRPTLLRHQPCGIGRYRRSRSGVKHF